MGIWLGMVLVLSHYLIEKEASHAIAGAVTAEATPAAQARARPVGVAHLGHCAFAPELCEIELDDRRFRRKSGDAGDEGPGDESLRPEAKDNAVSGRGLRWPGSVDHAVVIDRLGRGNLDVTERPLVRPWLPGDDRFHLVSRKDRVDVKTAAEAEGIGPERCETSVR